MLLQSHTGTVRVFPAVPESWADVGFSSLRAEGAFLISAEKKAGRVVEVRVFAEKGGRIRLENPFAGGAYKASGGMPGAIQNDGPLIRADLRPGDEIIMRPR
jgi:alpha-L-fucosidase 2